MMKIITIGLQNNIDILRESINKTSKYQKIIIFKSRCNGFSQSCDLKLKTKKHPSSFFKKQPLRSKFKNNSKYHK